ncbi:MAG: class I SAM-dependent methyltransferase [Rhodospirillaceae bacterium]
MEMAVYTQEMASFDRPADPAIAPSAWVLRWAHLIRPAGRVLDVAAGHGRHARALQAMGHQVVATDIDVGGLADASGIEVVTADLEAGLWPFPPARFDAIIVANYLHRPHFPHFVASLAPGGVLIFETFGQGNERLGRPRNPDFLLALGELLRAFQDTLEIVAYEHGEEREPRPAVRQRLCARKEIGPVPLQPARKATVTLD